MTRGTRPPNTTKTTTLFWLLAASLFFLFLFLIRSILLPFVLGILIAYFIDPAADRLEKKGLSRSVAAGLIVVSFFVLIVVTGALIAPVLINQISGLVVALPGYVAALNQKFEPLLNHWLSMVSAADMEGIKKSLSDVSSVAVGMAGGFITGVFHSGMAFVNIVSLIVITPVVAFYLLKDWHRIVAHVNGLLPRAHASTIRGQLSIIDRTLAGFVHGQLNVCLLMSIYYCVLLSVFDLKFSIVIGAATGILIIVPYMGWMVGTVIGTCVAFFQFDSSGRVFIILGVFFVGMVIEGYGLTPKMVGAKVGLHPVWIIFGLLAGGALFGFVGVLLAVPVTAVIGVLIRFGISRYRESPYYLTE